MIGKKKFQPRFHHSWFMPRLQHRWFMPRFQHRWFLPRIREIPGFQIPSTSALDSGLPSVVWRGFYTLSGFSAIFSS
jgi:hypothetical protein